MGLSVPHHLLVIGLWQGVFVEFLTINDLFDSKLDRTSIKTEFLNKPVLLIGTINSLGLNNNYYHILATSFTNETELCKE